MANERVYAEIRDLVESMGGTMTYHPGGSPAGGGVWRISLHGEVAEVDCRDRRANELDSLYETSAEDPQTWDDWPDGAQLKEGAFWLLVDLVGERTPSEA